MPSANDFAVSQEATRNEPDLSYLPNLRPAIQIMHLMNACINTVLIPLAASNTTVRRDMEKTTNLAVNRLEDKINSIMQRTIDVALAWVSKLLANQKKSDFRPRDDALSGSNSWLEMLQTPVSPIPIPHPVRPPLQLIPPPIQTCLAIHTFLTRTHALTTPVLDGPNLTSFLTELALGLRTLLLEHFKRFQVNAAGGLMVTKDLTKYTELLRAWPLDDSFAPSMEILSELGNLFVIGPEALRERLRGWSALMGVEKADLRPFVLRREDAGSVGVQSVLNSL